MMKITLMIITTIISVCFGSYLHAEVKANKEEEKNILESKK